MPRKKYYNLELTKVRKDKKYLRLYREHLVNTSAVKVYYVYFIVSGISKRN
jgi:hypothetical protein